MEAISPSPRVVKTVKKSCSCFVGFHNSWFAIFQGFNLMMAYIYEHTTLWLQPKRNHRNQDETTETKTKPPKPRRNHDETTTKPRRIRTSSSWKSANPWWKLIEVHRSVLVTKHAWKITGHGLFIMILLCVGLASVHRKQCGPWHLWVQWCSGKSYNGLLYMGTLFGQVTRWQGDRAETKLTRLTGVTVLTRWQGWEGWQGDRGDKITRWQVDMGDEMTRWQGLQGYRGMYLM